MPSLGSGFKRIAIVNASGWVLSDQTPDSNLGCGGAVTGQTRLQVAFFSWNSAIWGGPTGTRMNLSCKKPKRGGTDKSKGGNFNLARRDGTSEVLNLSAPTNWACAAFCICVVTGTFPFCCFCSGWWCYRNTWHQPSSLETLSELAWKRHFLGWEGLGLGLDQEDSQPSGMNTIFAYM